MKKKLRSENRENSKSHLFFQFRMGACKTIGDSQSENAVLCFSFYGDKKTCYRFSTHFRTLLLFF